MHHLHLCGRGRSETANVPASIPPALLTCQMLLSPAHSPTKYRNTKYWVFVFLA